MADRGEKYPLDIPEPKTTATGMDLGTARGMGTLEEDVKSSFAKKINEVSRRAARKERQRPVGPDERVEVDRTALNAILDVGSRVKEVQKKTIGSRSTSVISK